MPLELDLILEYISEDSTFWPDDNYFSKRNALKIRTALGEILGSNPGITIRDVAYRINQCLDWRCEHGRAPTVYIVSKGGSGCHFLGGMLAMLDTHQCIDEVYFPGELLRLASESGPAEANMMIDLVNFLHIGDIGQGARKSAVNLMHLRADTPLSTIEKIDSSSRFILLVRNPISIAISRAFRKDEYRRNTAGFGSKEYTELDDDEYLTLQCETVQQYFQSVLNPVNEVDSITVRYEDLVEDTTAALESVFRHLGIDQEQIDIGDLLNRYRQQNNMSKNHNKEPHPVITARQGRIVHDTLSETCIQLGYQMSW